MGDLAQRSFQRQGWGPTCLLSIDPREVAAQIEQERLAAIDAAIEKAENGPVREKRKGWIFFNRRTIYCWGEVEHVDEVAARASKAAEHWRLRSEYGDSFK